MKHFLFFVFLFACGISNAQTVVEIKVCDKETRDPLPSSTVLIRKNGFELPELTTDKEGKAYAIAEKLDSLRIEVVNIVYNSEVKNLIVAEKDTIRLVFALKISKVQTLEEAIVRPVGLPVKVFSSERVSVDDFDFLADGRMVLLTYPKTKLKGTELCIYDGKKIVSEIPLAENGQEIIRDFRGNPHVVTQNKVYGITANEAIINVGELDKAYFLKYIAPLVDSTITHYFFSTFSPVYPAFEYYGFEPGDTNYRQIAEVRDELMMELYRSEYKWVDVRTKLWAKEMENKTGIDAEIWVGANYFTQSVYYKELYAPLFERNDSLFLFDHYKNLLFRYDNEGMLIDSLPIFHHLQPKQTGWKKELIQDQITGEVYAVYENAGWTTLRRIDLNTGEGKEAVPAHYRYADKFLIRNNIMYYTYRPFESAQKKFLYQEAMPLRYPEAEVLSGDKVLTEVQEGPKR